MSEEMEVLNDWATDQITEEREERVAEYLKALQLTIERAKEGVAKAKARLAEREAHQRELLSMSFKDALEMIDNPQPVYIRNTAEN